MMFMKAALSRNEMEILDRHVATLTHQLSEIAELLESRLGDTNDLATVGEERATGVCAIRASDSQADRLLRAATSHGEDKSQTA